MGQAAIRGPSSIQASRLSPAFPEGQAGIVADTIRKVSYQISTNNFRAHFMPIDSRIDEKRDRSTVRYEFMPQKHAYRIIRAFLEKIGNMLMPISALWLSTHFGADG